MLITVGALISVYGFLSAQMLLTPRLTFAMGERGDLPALFAGFIHGFARPMFLFYFLRELSGRWPRQAILNGM